MYIDSVSALRFLCDCGLILDRGRKGIFDYRQSVDICGDLGMRSSEPLLTCVATHAEAWMANNTTSLLIVQDPFFVKQHPSSRLKVISTQLIATAEQLLAYGVLNFDWPKSLLSGVYNQTQQGLRKQTHMAYAVVAGLINLSFSIHEDQETPKVTWPLTLKGDGSQITLRSRPSSRAKRSRPVESDSDDYENTEDEEEDEEEGKEVASVKNHSPSFEELPQAESPEPTALFPVDDADDNSSYSSFPDVFHLGQSQCTETLISNLLTDHRAIVVNDVQRANSNMLQQHQTTLYQHMQQLQGQLASFASFSNVNHYRRAGAHTAKTMRQNVLKEFSQVFGTVQLVRDVQHLPWPNKYSATLLPNAHSGISQSLLQIFEHCATHSKVVAKTSLLHRVPEGFDLKFVHQFLSDVPSLFQSHFPTDFN